MTQVKPTCIVRDCEHPDRPIHDGAYGCAHCGEQLAKALRLVAALAGEAEITIARLDRVPRHGQARHVEQGWHKGESALRPTPLAYSPDAAKAHDSAVNTLTTWARHIVEETGRALPRPRPARSGLCGHSSCAAIRTRRARGPVCQRLPDQSAEHPLAALALWLGAQEQIGWLRYRPEADEAFSDIMGACRKITLVVDLSPEPAYWGPCTGCGAELRAPAKAKTIRCRNCGTPHDPAERREAMIEKTMEQIASPGWIVAMLRSWGYPVTEAAIRNWAERRQLWPRRSDANGRKLYLVEDVWTLMVERDHRIKMRHLKAAVREAERASQVCHRRVGCSVT